jgi:predicted DNA-binding ArsR family transcriptional regulator
MENRIKVLGVKIDLDLCDGLELSDLYFILIRMYDQISDSLELIESKLLNENEKVLVIQKKLNLEQDSIFLTVQKIKEIFDKNRGD